MLILLYRAIAFNNVNEILRSSTRRTKQQAYRQCLHGSCNSIRTFSTCKHSGLVKREEMISRFQIHNPECYHLAPSLIQRPGVSRQCVIYTHIMA